MLWLLVALIVALAIVGGIALAAMVIDRDLDAMTGDGRDCCERDSNGNANPYRERHHANRAPVADEPVIIRGDWDFTPRHIVRFAAWLEEGQWNAISENLPGLVVAANEGQNFFELIETAKEVTNTVLESYRERGKPIPWGKIEVRAEDIGGFEIRRFTFSVPCAPVADDSVCGESDAAVCGCERGAPHKPSDCPLLTVVLEGTDA